MSIKLSDTQLAMVRAAAQRDDRCLTPSPTLKDGAAQKVAAKLTAAKREIKAKAATPVWRRDGEGGRPLALKLTAAGLKAVAVNKETAAPEAIAESTNSVDAAAGFKHPDDAAPREGSKLAAVVAMLRRNQGATIGDLTAATGWLPHTTRAAITGLRNRGYSVIHERIEDGGSAYRISDAPRLDGGPRQFLESLRGRRILRTATQALDAEAFKIRQDPRQGGVERRQSAAERR